MFKSIGITELGSEHAESLSNLLLTADKNYSQYFKPFSFDKNSIKKILEKAKNDKYFGIFIDDELVGFFMLRGFNEGYEVPSYGVWVSEKFSGLGLSKLTLHYAITFCKLNGLKKIMLKVHPDNIVAKSLYESLGFIKIGFDDKNSNYIYHKSISN